MKKHIEAWIIGVILGVILGFAITAYSADAPKPPSRDELIELRGRNLQMIDSITQEANTKIRALQDNITNINAELAKDSAAAPADKKTVDVKK